MNRIRRITISTAAVLSLVLLSPPKVANANVAWCGGSHQHIINYAGVLAQLDQTYTQRQDGAYRGDVTLALSNGSGAFYPGAYGWIWCT